MTNRGYERSWRVNGSDFPDQDFRSQEHSAQDFLYDFLTDFIHFCLEGTRKGRSVVHLLGLSETQQLFLEYVATDIVASRRLEFDERSRALKLQHGDGKITNAIALISSNRSNVVFNDKEGGEEVNGYVGSKMSMIWDMDHQAAAEVRIGGTVGLSEIEYETADLLHIVLVRPGSTLEQTLLRPLPDDQSYPSINLENFSYRDRRPNTVVTYDEVGWDVIHRFQEIFHPLGELEIHGQRYTLFGSNFRERRELKL